MDMKKIGEFLKNLRKERGLTQEQLAEILFVSGRTISRWETGTNMPDLSILIQMAEFYDVEIKEILEGERKNGIMEKELKETLSKVADYNKMEKEKAAKAGNIAFCLIFLVCAAVIVIQLIAAGDLLVVAGETVTLLVGGAAYIGIMVHNGVWETGSRFKSTPLKDILISVVCAAVFTAALALCYVRLGAGADQIARISIMFFAGITIVCFGVLRILACCNSKRNVKTGESKNPEK